MKEAADLLTEARAVIADPAQWCQRAPARNHNDTPTDPTSEFAQRWCIMGAIHKVCIGGRHSPVVAMRATRAITQSLVPPGPLLRTSPATWNDMPERTHEQVLAAFDRAIEKLKDAPC